MEKRKKPRHFVDDLERVPIRLQHLHLSMLYDSSAMKVHDSVQTRVIVKLSSTIINYHYGLNEALVLPRLFAIVVENEKAEEGKNRILVILA